MKSHHYEERLEADLSRIEQGVDQVATAIRTALEASLRALLNRDRDLAQATILGDNEINRTVEKLDSWCHAFVARHLPSAGPLRYISSVLRMNISLERIGDYAVTICRESLQLSKPLGAELRREVQTMGRDSIDMYGQAIQAFLSKNADAAGAIGKRAYQIERSFQAAFEELVEEGKSGNLTVRDMLASLVILNRIERISDQAKNICEYAVFATTGETKRRRKIRILFLEDKDNARSQMAAAIASKSFPKSGTYTTAGLHPSEALYPGLTQFLENRGMPVPDAPPSGIDWTTEEWRQFDIVVSLDGPVDRYSEIAPFKTIALTWEMPELPGAAAGAEEANECWEALYRSLSANIAELMTTLRGQDAE